jgi:8-oxo-dGTP diphosphatase
LIGGGVEKNENLEQTLRREVLEESGCDMQIIKELGYTEEYKILNNFIQILYSKCIKTRIHSSFLYNFIVFS